MLAEELVKTVLGSTERKVTDKQGLGRSRLLIVEDSGSLLRVGGSGGGEVDLDRSAVNLLTVELECLSGSLRGRELDVTETSGSLGLSVNHDLGADDFTTLGEL